MASEIIPCVSLTFTRNNSIYSVRTLFFRFHKGGVFVLQNDLLFLPKEFVLDGCSSVFIERTKTLESARFAIWGINKVAQVESWRLRWQRFQVSLRWSRWCKGMVKVITLVHSASTICPWKGLISSRNRSNLPQRITRPLQNKAQMQIMVQDKRLWPNSLPILSPMLQNNAVLFRIVLPRSLKGFPYICSLVARIRLSTIIVINANGVIQPIFSSTNNILHCNYRKLPENIYPDKM